MADAEISDYAAEAETLAERVDWPAVPNSPRLWKSSKR